MGVLPQNESFLLESEIERKQTSLKTYQIKDNHIQGYIDDELAIIQAVKKIIRTERANFLVYDWEYGIELMDLYGQSQDYVIAELKSRFEEAILQNPHILSMKDFQCEKQDNEAILVNIVLETKYGEIKIEEEVL